MSRLIPGLPTDIFKKVDELIADVHPLLEKVEDTLISVDGTLGDATAVLTDVRELLVHLETRLEVLGDVPAMKQQLAEVHSMLKKLTAAKK